MAFTTPQPRKSSSDELPRSSNSPSTNPPAPAVEKMRADRLHAFFGKTEAIKGVSMGLADREVTAIIGPSGCGKSTFIRCFNRMHEVVPGARAEGRVMLDGVDIYERGV